MRGDPMRNLKSAFTLIFIATVALTAACGRTGVDEPRSRTGVQIPDFGDETTPTPPQAVCEVPQIDLEPVRPTEIMSLDLLAQVASRMPCIGDPELVALFESPDTLWYDKTTMIPAYQDSSGDNVTFPVGMRPNTIDPNLIVEGGHEAFFEDVGHFHFPFGRPLGSPDGATFVVDFWHVPRVDGQIVPVVWWFYGPNSFTWRYEWMFPRDTVLGELLFVVDAAGDWFPFEIRTRTRTLDGWDANVYRPFPRATELAAALEKKRSERSDWETDPEIDALIAHLADDHTLVSAQLSAPDFPTVLPTIDGAKDTLPGLTDPSILEELMLEHPFQSTYGTAWKTDGTLRAWAPTTNADFHIVPTDYNGGFLEVSNESCARCHADAGHPFKDFHSFVYLYGEMWGADEAFSWHPFEKGLFVNPDGTVKNFNYDNREIRSDFADTGLVVPYDPNVHGTDTYSELVKDWSGYAY